MRLFKKAIKIIGLLLFTFLVGFYTYFYKFTAPKPDSKVLYHFRNSAIQPQLSYQKFKGATYRKVTVVKDTALPTMVFIHGAIGSVLDFNRYMNDSLLQVKTNMIAYDRLGYGYKDKNNVLESIAKEVELLEDLIDEIPSSKIVLVGYSYGGPIALASKKKYKSVFLLAPAVSSKAEVYPSMIQFYKWKATKWLVPPVWKQASREKLSHRNDLKNFENYWNTSPSKIVSLHGDADGIVPFANSEYLQKKFPKEQFELLVLKGAGHGLVWSRFQEIREQLLKQLD